MKAALALILLAGLLGLAACGGDDGGSSTEAATVAETTGAATAASTEGGASAADGAAVFASAGCGGCHTLKAANTMGAAGPNLDDLKPSEEQVATQVENGGGGMPAFGDQLSDAEIAAVAAYVSQNAGR
ncbi:MAG: c-type cytochrome [Pseudomonadota bacterium]